MDLNNGYLPHTLEKWLADFRRQIRRNLHKLTVKSRLKFEELFDDQSQQLFIYLTARAFYADRSSDNSSCLSEEDGNRLFAAPQGQSQEMPIVMEGLDLNGAEDMDQSTYGLQVAQPDGALLALDAESMGPLDREQALARAELEMQRTIDANWVLPDAGNGNDELPGTEASVTEPGVVEPGSVLVSAGEEELPTRRPTMILPFVPRTSDKLWKIVAQHGLSTWFSYPGHLSDLFSLKGPCFGTLVKFLEECSD